MIFSIFNQPYCTLSKHTRRWTYSALRYFLKCAPTSANLNLQTELRSSECPGLEISQFSDRRWWPPPPPCSKNEIQYFDSAKTFLLSQEPINRFKNAKLILYTLFFNSSKKTVNMVGVHLIWKVTSKGTFWFVKF